MNRLVLALCAGLASNACHVPASHEAPPAPSPSANAEVAHYTCPMHPSVHSDAPGRCPICGMDLVAVRIEAAGEVRIDPVQQQFWGIRSVQAQVRSLSQPIRLAGPIGWDLHSQHDVVVKATGTITDLRVSIGSVVRRSDALFSVQSPELMAAQRDFLRVSGEARASASARLIALGLTRAQVELIASRGSPLESVPILAPSAGVVTDLSVVNGSPLEGWSVPARIADANRVWVEATSAEADAVLLRSGAHAQITTSAVPDRVFHGLVTPIPSANTVIQRFRIEITDADGLLWPGLVAVAEVVVETPPAVVVPADAVIYAGRRTLVFVDQGEGRLQRREVRVLSRNADFIALSSGVAPEERVVRDGNFLVAADSRMHAPDLWEDADPAPVDASEAAHVHGEP